MKEWSDKDANVEIDICVIGAKKAAFFNTVTAAMLLQLYAILAMHPAVADLIGSVKIMLDSFADNNEIDKLYLVGNEFINTMTQKPVVDQLLPLLADDNEEATACHWDYLYEPEAEAIAPKVY